MNVCNEVHLLKDCISSLKGFADEIIASDMGSVDGSAEALLSMGCVVLRSERRPYGEYTLMDRMRRATGAWVLLFDPDMRLPSKTATRLKDIVINDECDVVQFYLRNKVFGQFVTHGHASAGFYIKFFKRDLFLRSGDPPVRIHTMVRDTLQKSSARWLVLNREYSLDHLAYDSIQRCFEQHLRYAKEEAQERHDAGERFRVPALFWQPIRKLLIDLVYRAAWRDGFPAIVYSGIAALMTLQIHLFLWELERQKVARQ